MKLTMFAMLVVIICSCIHVYMHEQTHVEIYRHYGIDSHVEYFSHFPDAVTIAEERCPTEACILANRNSDNIAYNLFPMYAGIAMLLIIMISILEFMSYKIVVFK